jgi:acetyltransferase-like isoleucine patch superfamily enzyme
MQKITRIINNLRKDSSGYFFFYLRLLSILYPSKINTLFVRYKASLQNIQLGKNNQFYGVAYFHRRPLSFITIGDNCVFRSDSKSNLVGVNRHCMISTLRENSQIIIGNSCGFSGTVVGSAEYIHIGNNVLCGANTLITDTDWHPVDPVARLKKDGTSESKPVYIEDNVWLGINCIVLKGVTIGTNSIIGANSVVTKNIPSNVIAAGNPCKVIKTIQSSDQV